MELAVWLSLFIVFVLSTIFYAVFLHQKSKKPKEKRLVVLFIDAPDPDNPAAAAAIIKHVLKTSDQVHAEAKLHIVLTGRPVDLKTSKASKGVLLLENLTRQVWEEAIPLHGQRVLEDAAARIRNYLTNCGVDSSMITLYDGGVAPCAPMSDKVHDWDFLFDRKDLVTGQKVDEGSILTPEEYRILVDEISSLSGEEREGKLLSVLRSYPLAPLVDLRKEMESDSCGEIVLFLGGPATALVQLFLQGDSLRPKVVSLYGMFGSLKPGEKTLFPNQFNVACDVEAASELFISNLLPGAEKYLVTTETAKSKDLVVSSQDLQERRAGSYFTDLQRLWESTHSRNPQPMFDVLPVMAYLEKYKGCFKWSRKKAVLQELQRKGEDVQQVFRFADSEDSTHILVSDGHTQDLDKNVFVEFLCSSWR